MEKISGPALCGFADVFEEGSTQSVDVVGAGGGKVKVLSLPKAKQSSTIANHAKTLKSARTVLAKAHGQVRKAARQTLAKPHPTAAHAAARTRVAVRGDGYALIGAAPVETPKVKAARAKLAKANDAVKKAKTVADNKTKVAHGSVVKLAHQVKSHENLARKLNAKSGAPAARATAARGPSTRQPGARGPSHAVSTHMPARAGVHGDYVGDDANGLWPGDEGYDPTTENGTNGPRGTNPWDASAGTVDPGTGLPTPVDPSTGAPIDPVQLDLETLVTITPAGSVAQDQPFATPPGDAILYDGSKGTPDGYLLSAHFATRETDVGCEPNTAQIDGNAHFGYVYGRYDKSDPANGGIPWGSHLAKGAWNHVHGRFYMGWDEDWHNVVSAEEAYASAQKQSDLGMPGTHAGGFQTTGAYGPGFKSVTYGPLIGNPAMKDFVNMRCSADGKAFWIASEAPDWLTAPLKAAAALTKAAAAKAAADAAAAEAAANAKLAADNAAALAAQQAQNALDEANAASQGRQATSQAQGQADLADAAAAQAESQYSAADASNAAAQYQQDQAERQWQFQQAQQQAAMDQQQMQMEQQYQQQQMQLQMQQQQMMAQAAQQSSYAAPPQPQQDQQQEEQQPLYDDTVESPEQASDDEAAAINQEDLDASEDVLGAAALEQVLGTPTIAGDDAVIGGDGEVIGLDQYGNLTE